MILRYPTDAVAENIQRWQSAIWHVVSIVPDPVRAKLATCGSAVCDGGCAHPAQHQSQHRVNPKSFTIAAHCARYQV
jgi:hypothetical protein